MKKKNYLKLAALVLAGALLIFMLINGKQSFNDGINDAKAHREVSK